jgi:predicted transcriptional regulator
MNEHDEQPPKDPEEVAADESGRPDSRLYTKVTNFNRFVDEAGRGLSDGEFKVWCALFRFASDGFARVSKATVGERVGKSERQVARLITSLIKKGLVKQERQGGYKRGSNVYRLGIKRLEKAPEKARCTKTSVGPHSPRGPTL